MNLKVAVFLLLFSTAAVAQLNITTGTPPVATQYLSYSTQLSATGGTQPYTWSVVSSTGVSLPEGMTLNPATGVVSAIQVNGAGGYSVTVQVSDGGSPSPAVATATLNFGVNSDSSYGGCSMFPADSIYNQRIDQLPVDVTPAHQIPSSYLNSPLHPDFGAGFYPGPGGIPFLRVPANQPPINVYLANGGQIDAAGTWLWPFLAWPNQLIEGTSYGQDGDDHHILVLQSSVNNITGPQTGACILYETYQDTAVPSMYTAATSTWSTLAGIHYNLGSDEIAASAGTLDDGAQDSPGIPMVPLLVRYADVPLGVQHPLRITFPSPTNGYVWPGTGCCAGSGPPQGLLYRLKASVNWQSVCPSGAYPQAATVLQALQQYGAYMSDHGSAGYISGAPDPRWNDNDLGCIKNIPISDLEVVNNSALEVSDISGQTMPYVAPAILPSGTVGASFSTTIAAVGGNPATRSWSISSGSLPPGLLLNASTAIISGIASSSTGSPFSFGVVATDTASGLASQPQIFSIGVTGGSTVAITVTTSPAGLALTVDGTSYTAPQAFNWMPGSTHTIAAPTPQGTGTRSVFASWSDSGAQSHTVTAPASAATYTATFSTQYLLTTSVTGSGTITANPSSSDGYYNSGVSVQLTAAPLAGYTFSSFSGALIGTTNPQSVIMSAPRTVTAAFALATVAASAAFVKADKTTAGSWSGVYGANGYDVIGNVASVPSYVAMTPSGNNSYVWAASTTDPRGLQMANNLSSRIAACWYTSSSFTVDLAFTDANTHQLGIYVVDWDNYNGRSERADILDANGNLLNSESVASFVGGQYLLWNVTGHVVLRITNLNSNSNAVISGLFFDPSGAVPGPVATGAATFVTTDNSTAGTWKGVYGGDGYNVIGDTASIPAYVAVTPSGNSSDVWASSSTDPRALQKASSATDRIAACWYTSGTLNIDLNFTDGNTHQVAGYLLDWDNYNGRSETVQILDANGILLDTRPVANFVAGEYLVWNLQGHVILRITNVNSSSNAVISGLFFGRAGTATPPASTASFVKVDTSTSGSWMGVYGADGYNVIGNAASIPSYVNVTPSGNSSYVWASPTTDPRGLEMAANPSSRLAACWYTPGTMNIDLAFTDSSTHAVAVYLIDWDNYYGRSEQVEILDASGNVLDTRSVSSFSAGEYLVWNLTGHVILRITNLNSNSNAVISGLFFR